jgi:hypothetical protein
MLTRLEFVARRAAYALAMLAPLFMGCERADKRPVPLTDRSDTPQGHLKNVIRRLEFALKGAKPAAGSGVKSERKCAYQLISPTNEGDDYTAEVTIQTSRALAPSLAGKRKPQPPAEGEASIRPISDDPDATNADPTTSVESAVYKLAYKNHRWELVDPPQDKLPETESICFQYALSDG